MTREPLLTAQNTKGKSRKKSVTAVEVARAILIGRVRGLAETIRHKGGIGKLSRGTMCVMLEDLLTYEAEYATVYERERARKKRPKPHDPA